MNLYIIFTVDIHPIGGMQTYVAGKVSYLKEMGWDVAVFFAGSNKGECKYSELNDYVDGGMTELYHQPYEWTKQIRDACLNRMASKVLNARNKYHKIIVESHSDTTAIWGEMLAEKIEAKHICLICNERFRGSDKHYEENLDFFDFKHIRREVAGIHNNSMKMLFEDYKEVPEEECYMFRAANGGPVREVCNSKVEALERKDWNICYIGRAGKEYVPVIIEDVSAFASRHIDKQIQMIFVGNAVLQEKLISDKLQSLPNVSVVLLGDLVPIPKSLYRKVDVVIAGSGCALISANENVPTIVADAGDCMANGILGYTTYNYIFREENVIPMHYDEVLEQVLVQQIIRNIPYVPLEYMDSNLEYEKHLKFVEQSVQEKEYFKFNKKYRKMGTGEIIKYYIAKWFPYIVEKYMKIKKDLKR